MNYRDATRQDAQQLAVLNAQLIRDEGHRNPMSVPQLAERMSGWLVGEYRAVIFEDHGAAVGYALFRQEPEYVNLRQLFVRPEFRRQGIGRAAVEWLWHNAWPGVSRVRIDVLIDNASAQAFWRSIGFRDYCLTMETERHDPAAAKSQSS